MNKKLTFQVLSVIGAAGFAISVWLPWVLSQKAKTISLHGLVSKSSAAIPASNLFVSLGLVLLIAAVLALVGAALVSKIWTGLAALVGLVTTILWTSSTASDLSQMNFGIKSIQSGAWVAYVATLLIVVAFIILMFNKVKKSE